MLRKLEHQRSNTGRLVTQHRLKEWVKIQFSSKDENKNEINNDRKKKKNVDVEISDSMSLALRHSDDSITLRHLDSDFEKRKSDSRRRMRRNSGFIDSIEETFAKGKDIAPDIDRGQAFPSSVTIVEDGSYAITAGRDGKVKAWNLDPKSLQGDVRIFQNIHTHSNLQYSRHSTYIYVDIE